MIDLWGQNSRQVWGPEYEAGSKIEVPVMAKNDSGRAWSGAVVLRLVKSGKVIHETTRELAVAQTQRATTTFTITCPDSPGTYELIAELKDGNEPVRSYRRIEVLAEGS